MNITFSNYENMKNAWSLKGYKIIMICISYMYLVVGCGLSGAVVAERIASILKQRVLIIEKTDHIAGNCYDYVDKETGILCNKYGVHLFHTNNERVWEYINQFDKWVRWEHKVLSYVDDRFVSVPVNITTINELCGTHIKTQDEIREWLNQNQIKYDTITNSEEMALSRIGHRLYDKLIKDYTYKQWNKYPVELDKSVLKRIPIREDFDTRYFTDKYQVLPQKGYTYFVQQLLKNPLIEVRLNTDFDVFKQQNDMSKFTKIIYTGPIDKYFANHNYEKLEYRSIEFIREVYKNTKYYQPSSQVNYPSAEYAYTRIVEYKHLLNQKSDHTIIFKEVTNDNGDPYYPVPTKRNQDLYEKYRELADQEPNVYFVGRLANYKYFNMDEAIYNALCIADKIISIDIKN
jgi:UDP-galactopyranose mutase